jgi:hypothetical protein
LNSHASFDPAHEEIRLDAERGVRRAVGVLIFRTTDATKGAGQDAGDERPEKNARLHTVGIAKEKAGLLTPEPPRKSC